MVRKILLVTIATIYLFVFKATGQVITISNGTISACAGTFYDTGGSSGGYSSNENFTYTICSDVPGNCVSLTFIAFQLENNFDFLYIFNGPSTSSPLLGTYTGSTLPGTITATAGCLTIKFVSDYTVNKNGWEAFVGCAPCPVSGCPSCSGGAPPANDACAGAQNLGALPVPIACPIGTGTVQTTNTSNLCATAEIPYNALQGCKPVGDMAAPASDVWYKFTITAPILNVQINGMITPEVGLYSGTGCNNLVPRGCAIGGGGSLNTTFSGLAPGTYYLQVSGGTITDQCNFTLSLQNNFDCAGCVTQSGLSVNPPPQNGIYLAGQTVNFCLNITGFNASSANWLHGVVPNFGPGWDMATLVTLPPASCTGNGTWAWYSSPVTSSATGATEGPGFFYETSAGNAGGVVDANPGNNFGDNFTAGCNWNFCWRINTVTQANCVDGENLNIFIDTYGDGETGSWTSTACVNDPVNDFYASLACCIPPTINVTNPLCNGQAGSAVGTGLGSGPWIYIWKNSVGTILQQTAAINTTNPIINLAPGSYTLHTIDIFGCEVATTFIVTEPQLLGGNINITPTKCALSNGIIDIIASGGTSPYIYSNNNGVSYQPSNQFKNLAPGNYTVVILDSHGCTHDTTVNVPASTLPVFTNIVTQNILCNGGDDGHIFITATSGIAPYQYSYDGGLTFQASNQFLNLEAYNYHLSIMDANGCEADTIILLTEPPMVNLQTLATPSDCGLNNGTITLNILSGTTGSVIYSITDGLNFQAGNSFANLAPGVYDIVIQDGNGCLVQDTVIVNNINAPTINSLISVNLTCYHSGNGSITINASGGAGGLQYSINAGVTFSGVSSYIGLAAGAYIVVVKDANNCRISTIINLTEPPSIIFRGDMFPTTCGLNNGTIIAYPDNAVLPVQFSSDGGVTWQSSNTFNNLPSGLVTLIVKDANGCTQTRSWNIPVTTGPSVSVLAITDASCFGSATGSVTINTAGGTPPIQYSIDGGVTFSVLNTFNGLVAGNYSVVLKDVNNCIGNSNFIITQPTQLNLNAVVTNATCGLANGTITLNALGGSPAYTFSNDGGLTFFAGNVFSNLPFGNYKVVVKDGNGCEEATNVNINDSPSPRIILLTSTPQICNDFPNAVINLTVVSGTAPLLFSADSGLTFIGLPTLTNLAGGIHYIIVQDANNCKDTTSVFIPTLNSPVINISNFASINCFGADNGIININASGGNGILQYSINSGLTTQPLSLFDSLAPSIYYIVVSDTNQCKARDTVSITEPTDIAFASTVSSEKCHRNNGTFILNAAGGTPAYYFSINNSAFSLNTNYTSLDSGLYHVVINDANGCADSIDVVVPFDAAPKIDSIQILNVSCNGAGDGAITIFSSGGSGNLIFSNDNGLNYQPTNNFTSLNAINYTLVTSDTNNCIVDSIIKIDEPIAINALFQTVSANCILSNGAITVNASGGAGPLSFDINHSGVFNPSNTFNNLASGNYTITVKDSTGCTKDFIASVNTINGPVIQNLVSANVTCSGGTNGTISIVANGGTGALNYSIDNGATFQPTGNFPNLIAGTYSIVIADFAGCNANSSIDITEPSEIVLNFITTPATCGQSNGDITVAAAGGTGALSYSIDSVNYQASAFFSSLVAGPYQIVVTDANNCVAAQNVAVVNLLAPSINAVVVKNVKCFGDALGEITIGASGGVGAISYSVNNGTTYQTGNIFDSLSAGTYHVYIQDQNNCLSDSLITITQPDSLQISPVVKNESCSYNNGNYLLSVIGGVSPFLFSVDSGLTYTSATFYQNQNAGNYNVVIKDANGCKTFQTITLIDLPGPQMTNVAITNVSCFGGSNGSVTVTAQAGNGTLNYSINNMVTFQSSNQFNGLAKNNYIIYVVDSNNCYDTIHATISQPYALTTTKSFTNISCFNSNNGTFGVIPLGGTPSYSIAWSNGITNDFTLLNLAAGTYVYTVTDQNLCTRIDSATLTQPQVMTATHNALNGSCAGSANASATINVVGGTSPYSFIWNPSVSNINYASNLSAGNYTVTVTDVQGCTLNHLITITNPTPVVAQLQSLQVNCFGGNDASITVIPAGGYSPYNYYWYFSGDTTQTADSLSTGIYTVLITDNNGCTIEKTDTIISPTAINFYGTISNASCFGYNNASITLQISGGATPYTYLWSNGTTTSVATNLSAGNYTVTITDAHNCTKQSSLLVAQPAAVFISATSIDTICIGQQASLACSATGGNGIFNYVWNTGQTSSAISISPNVTTNYSVQATDTNGCLSNIAASLVFVHPPLNVSISAGDTICEGESVYLTSSPAGGNGGPYAFSWNPIGANTHGVNVQPSSTTVYTVTITDNCTVISASASATVIVNPLPDVNFAVVPSEGCLPLIVNYINQSVTPLGSLWNWSLGDGTSSQVFEPQHEFTQSGNYDVTLVVTTPEQCRDSITLFNSINVYELPIASFVASPTTTTILNSEINFIDHSLLTTHWDWDFGDGSFSSATNPSYSYQDTGVYSVTLITTSEHQCVDTTYGEIIITGAYTVYIPNAFTPNSDGKNDFFSAIGFGILDLQMDIYNRWGNKIFAGKSLSEKWNGVDESGLKSPQGVYVYSIRLRDMFDKPHSYRGSVTLVR